MSLHEGGIDELDEEDAFTTLALVRETGVGIFDHIPAQNDRAIFAEVGVVYDRRTLQHSPPAGRVYLVYTDEVDNESHDTDIYVIYSDNDGQPVFNEQTEEWEPSWSDEFYGPTLVNDDGYGRSQFLPRIALDQKSGVIAVSWHDCRNDDGGTGPGNRKSGSNNDTQFFASSSVDGGKSFRENVLVSEGTSDEVEADVAAGDYIDYGDYTGLAFVDGHFYPAWADNSDCAGATTCDGVTGSSDGDNPDDTTTFDIYTAKVVPEPGQLFGLSSGIMALWGLSFLRARHRGLGRRLG